MITCSETCLEMRKCLVALKRTHEKNAPAGVYLKDAEMLVEIFLPDGGNYFEIIK